MKNLPLFYGEIGEERKGRERIMDVTVDAIKD